MQLVFRLDVKSEFRQLGKGSFEAWKPYTCIILAASEQEARKIATDHYCFISEDKSYDYWLDSEITDCETIDQTESQFLLAQSDI